MIDYIIFLDLEWTTEGSLASKEIIELAAVAYNVQRQQKTYDEFHSFVKPSRCPVLTPYCMNLTGISQYKIDQSPKLPEVMSAFAVWVQRYNRRFVNCRVVTWSENDMNVLEHNVDLLPEVFQNTLDLQAVFARFYPAGSKDLWSALEHVGVRPVGKKHSARCDARNLAALCDAMIQKQGSRFLTTM